VLTKFVWYVFVWWTL